MDIKISEGCCWLLLIQSPAVLARGDTSDHDSTDRGGNFCGFGMQFAVIVRYRYLEIFWTFRSQYQSPIHRISI